ncbi:hypothetical protein ACIBCN_19370 [Nocardia sp. NPDC051052]|uniref:hypothetical protein n=1 Tax=Nocardia sp. NPDC051052 TaxID=3364322 RepID=UPI0037A0E696
MNLLKEAYTINYDQQRHALVFDVRNAAAHMGFVDISELDEALNKMVEVCEELLVVVSSEHAELHREAYWGKSLVAQVDERLRQQKRERRIRFEQLKGLAARELERLRKRLDDDALFELAEKEPDSYFDDSDHSEERYRRRLCPVCGFDGWLEYIINRSGIITDGDYEGSLVRYVDLTATPKEFFCRACSLRLDEELLPEAGMSEEHHLEPAEPTQEELDAEEEYAIDSYLEQRRIAGRSVPRVKFNL